MDDVEDAVKSSKVYSSVKAKEEVTFVNITEALRLNMGELI